MKHQKGADLLVHPRGGDRGPVADLAGVEPQGNLLLGVLDRVRAVADVAADLQGVVAADRARRRLLRLGLAQHLAARLDG